MKLKHTDVYHIISDTTCTFEVHQFGSKIGLLVATPKRSKKAPLSKFCYAYPTCNDETLHSYTLPKEELKNE